MGNPQGFKVEEEPSYGVALLLFLLLLLPLLLLLLLLKSLEGLLLREAGGYSQKTKIKDE